MKKLTVKDGIDESFYIDLLRKWDRTKNNLKGYRDQLPNVYKNATINVLDGTDLAGIPDFKFEEPLGRSIVLVDTDTMHLNYVSHALVLDLIQKGVVLPSEVRRTSAVDGYNKISGMFEARDWKTYFFDNDAKVHIIDGLSYRTLLLGLKGETQFWREIMDFVKGRSKILIVEYEIEPGVYLPKIASDPSTKEDLFKMVHMRPLTQKEKENITNEITRTQKGV